MANGRVEIHDLLSNNNMASPNTDATSETTSMDDTIEFKLLMVYSQRRRPPTIPEPDGPRQTLSTQTAENNREVKEENRKKKKKRGAKGLSKMFSCIRPSVKNDEPSEPPSPALEPEFRCGVINTVTDSCLSDSEEKTDELDEVVDVLTEIADEIPFTPPDIEMDSVDDVEVEKVVALLLREAGDKLDQEIKDFNIAVDFFKNYSFFEKVMKNLMRKMGLISSEPDHLGPQASPKAQIAVTCEATSRLVTLTSYPARSMLGYGARYLQDYFSVWVTENGGYVEAFHSNDEEEVE